jgi:hypothetical protein
MLLSTLSAIRVLPQPKSIALVIDVLPQLFDLVFGGSVMDVLPRLFNLVFWEFIRGVWWSASAIDVLPRLFDLVFGGLFRVQLLSPRQIQECIHAPPH